MYRYIQKHLRGFLGVMGLVLLFNGTSIVSTLLHQRLVDAAMAQDLAAVAACVPWMLGLTAVFGALYITSAVSREVVNAGIICDMRLAVFGGILRRSRRDFGTVNSGDYVSALTNDMNHIQSGCLTTLYMLVLAATYLVTGGALMFYYQPLVAAAAVGSAVAITFAPLALGKAVAKWQKANSQRASELTAALTECFAGFETITSFGIRGHIQRRFRQRAEALRDAQCRAEGMETLGDGLAQLISILIQTGILVLSCYMVYRGRMTVGALVVFDSLKTSFCAQLSACYQLLPVIRGIRPVVDRVNAYADYEAPAAGGKAPTFREAVTVKDLTFGYEPERPVLRGLSLTLRRGGKYALTGDSGCGKTTLIRLLTGDYPDYGGEIRYDGAELRTLDRGRLNAVAACIHQDVFLFDDTIRNNICLWDDFPAERLDWAVRASGVAKFAAENPEGLEYGVGERGQRLSGGQRQRVAIARALLRNTRFLILDEGTSALDEATAREIEGELLGMPELTLLTITHHLRDGGDYDRVFRMEDGAVGEG